MNPAQLVHAIPVSLAMLLLSSPHSVIQAQPPAANEQAQPETKMPEKWKVTTGLKAPESIYVEPSTGDLFLSCIGEGGGDGKDGDGWIMRLNRDGQVLSEKWFIGLNSPKGLRSHGSTLYVSDFDRVVGIDLATAKQVSEILIPESKFLNDLACGPDGTVYVTDLVRSCVWAIQDGKASIFAESEELEHPNGILVDGDSLILGGWGRDLQPDFTTKVNGRLLRMNIATKEITAITTEPVGHLDGIESDGRGGYIVTDWMDGRLLRIGRRGRVRVLKTFAKGLADHAYLPEEKLLLLPEMMDNRLTAFEFEVPRRQPQQQGEGRLQAQ